MEENKGLGKEPLLRVLRALSPRWDIYPCLCYCTAVAKAIKQYPWLYLTLVIYLLQKHFGLFEWLHHLILLDAVGDEEE